MANLERFDGVDSKNIFIIILRGRGLLLQETIMFDRLYIEGQSHSYVKHGHSGVLLTRETRGQLWGLYEEETSL